VYVVSLLTNEPKNARRYFAAGHCPPVEPWKFVFREYRAGLSEGEEKVSNKSCGAFNYLKNGQLFTNPTQRMEAEILKMEMKNGLFFVFFVF